MSGYVELIFEGLAPNERQGPIKLGLVLASARLETLEVLLDTYVEIGEAIPGLKQYETVFSTTPLVMSELETIFYDILEFHRNALDIFSRSGER